MHHGAIVKSLWPQGVANLSEFAFHRLTPVLRVLAIASVVRIARAESLHVIALTLLLWYVVATDALYTRRANHLNPFALYGSKARLGEMPDFIT